MRAHALLVGAFLAGCANPSKTGLAGGASVASAPGLLTAAAAVASRFEGCLTEPNPEAKTRAMPAPDRVEVRSDGGMIQVAHHLNHACCLKADTRVEQAGKGVTLVEQLSGTPCRCRCASVIRSQIPLPSGAYDFRLRLEQSAGKTDLHHQSVTVTEETTKLKLPPKIKVNLGGPKP